MTAALTRRAALRGSAAVALGLATGVVPVLGAPLLSANDGRLGVMVERIDALQADADRHAVGAGVDPADPYTQAVAEMDLVAAGMAMLPADTLGGVLLKLRAMAVPIVADDDEHGLALSVCRDIARLTAAGRVAHA